jgi:hypothetical protein
VGGVTASESVEGGEGSWPPALGLGLAAGESLLDFVKKLGSGKADGAGEAWNVEPAKIGPALSGNGL